MGEFEELVAGGQGRNSADLIETSFILGAIAGMLVLIFVLATWMGR